MNVPKNSNTLEQPQKTNDPSSSSSLSSSFSPSNEHDSSHFRRYTFVGTWLHDQECLIGPRGPPPGALPDQPGSSAGGMSSAPQGYFVVTPLVVNFLWERNHAPATTSNGNSAKTTTTTTRSWWGSKSASSSTNHDTSNNNVVILVNRGWIPRHLVQGERARGQGTLPLPPSGDAGARPSDGRRGGAPPSWNRGPPPPGRGGGMPPASVAASSSSSSSSSKNLLLRPWERPVGPVQITVVPGKVEEPKFLKADHNLSQRPPRLYWFDWSTMTAVTGLPKTVAATTTTTTTESSPPSPRALYYWQQVKDDVTQPSATTTWPVQPSADKVGDFTISPAIHAAYAVTWFGLSTAGLYMTRILMTRGRG